MQPPFKDKYTQKIKAVFVHIDNKFKKILSHKKMQGVYFWEKSEHMYGADPALETIPNEIKFPTK